MPYGLTQTVPPSGQVVTTAEMRAWLRFDDDDTTQDAAVTSLIAAATEWVEIKTGRALLTQTWQLTLDRFPRYSALGGLQYQSDGLWDQRVPLTELSSRYWPDKATIRLPKSPAASVASVKYIDADGTLQTLDPAKYVVDVTTEPARIIPAYGQIWPVTRSIPAAAQVVFVCGYGAAAAVPERVKTAIRLLVGHWHENREAAGPQALSEAPLAVDALLMSLWTGDYR